MNHEWAAYIRELSHNDIPILKSCRKIGFLGFLVCIESLKEMYFKYVKKAFYSEFFFLFKFSQDHLENFFGVHSKGGFNNNPTPKH